MEEIATHLRHSHADERTPDQTEEQFLYKTRKKAYGPFKRALCDLGSDVRGAMGEALEQRFVFLFDKLGVQGTRALVDRFVRPVELPITWPGAE
jgi:hypothetical protein